MEMLAHPIPTSNPLAPDMYGLPDRIFDQILFEPNTGCWLWLGRIDRDGYGRTTEHGRDWLAHRYTYTHLVGPIGPRLCLDHTCRVRPCVNPFGHLHVVTRRENNLINSLSFAAHHALQTHCHQGHPFSDENTYKWRWMRRCRICHRERRARREGRRA